MQKNRSRWPRTVRWTLGFALSACGIAASADGVAKNAVAGAEQGGWLIGWGYPAFGADPGTSFIGIAAGHEHSALLNPDGSVSIYGGTDAWDQNLLPVPNGPFVSIKAGGTHTLALKEDGTTVAWGCGYPQFQIYSCLPASDFTADHHFVAISASGQRNLGLRADGSIFVWGNWDGGNANVPAPNTDFIAVAAGGINSYGLKSDGSIRAWGVPHYGGLNVPAPNSGFTTIAAGEAHAIALREDGSVATWGCGSPYDNGQCALPSPNSGFVAIAAGRRHNLALKVDGSIVAWGSTFNTAGVPQPNIGYTAISAGATHNLALRTDGSVAAWGSNTYGETSVPAQSIPDVLAIDSGFSYALLLRLDHTIQTLGVPAGFDPRTLGFANINNSNIIMTSADYSSNLALREGGEIVQFGQGAANGLHNVPSPDPDIVSIATGEGHGLALRSNGTIEAWGCEGSRAFGQCDVPLPNDDFTAVAASQTHSLALKSDGTVVVWGYSVYESVMEPPVPNGDFTAIDTSWFHHLGLRENGSIVAWGCDPTEQHGLDFGQCDVPEPNENFIAISAGLHHSMGLKSDGSVVAWGCEQGGWPGEVVDQGQCDPPANNVGFTAISAGQHHSLAIRGGIPYPPSGSMDGDNDVDGEDISIFFHCFGGPETPGFSLGCTPLSSYLSDLDLDGDRDLSDFAGVQRAFSGP